MYNDTILEEYFNSIKDFKPLSAVEEKKLIKNAQNGDRLSRDKVINANLKFVVKVACDFQNRGLELMDWIGEGNSGLMDAVDKFDIESDNKFVTYAIFWIKQRIMKALQDNVRLIKLPSNKNADLVQINREIEKRKKENLSLDYADIAKSLDMKKENVYLLLQISAGCISIDQEIDSNDGNSSMTLADTIESPYGNPEEDFEKKCEKEELYELISQLPERERQIIYMRFGLKDYQPMSLQDIGGVMNLTKERVRQLVEKALDTIRERIAV